MSVAVAAPDANQDARAATTPEEVSAICVAEVRLMTYALVQKRCTELGDVPCKHY
jgi:hypothetical protein